MWKNILANVARRQTAKDGTQAAVREQQKLQKAFEKRQKSKEAVWDSAVEQVVYRAYPPMAGYYASIGPFWTGFMIFLMIFLVGMLLYIFGLSIYEYGWETTISDIKDGLDACRWYHVMGGILYVLFMGSLFFISPFLTKYMENTVTIFTDKCVYVQRYLRKEEIVTYEELGVLIKRWKICIKNGRYMIPCKGGDISVPMSAIEFPSELFGLLERKCGIELPYNDIRHRAQRSGVGWACGHLGGGIMLIFALFINLFIFLFEGEFTWEKVFLDLSVNPLLWFALALLGLGLLFNLWFLPSAICAYRKYRKVIRVSLMPILVDALIIMMTIGFYVHIDGVVIRTLEEAARTEAEVMQEIQHCFINAYSRDVWRKDWQEFTEEIVMNAKEAMMEVLREYGIESDEEFYAADGETIAELYDYLKAVQEEYDLSEEDMEELMAEILG